MTKLNQQKICWLVRQVVRRGRAPSEIAPVYHLTTRRVQQLVKHFRETGTMPTLSEKRRPPTPLTEEQERLILQAYQESKLSGTVSLRLYLQKAHGMTIPYNKLHRFLRAKKITKPDKKKQRQRKYCRYERQHAFSLVHLDWHESKIKPGKYVCVVLDDATRLILAGGEFDNTQANHNLKLMKKAIKRATNEFSNHIRECNTDKGSQFYANKHDKKGQKSLSTFERFLKQEGINHTPSRRNHPQTNGKNERWFRTYEEKRGEFTTCKQFIQWYNNRLHLGLSRTEGITPKEAVQAKLRPENLIGLTWKKWNQ